MSKIQKGSLTNLREFLHDHTIAHISTADLKGKPSGATIFYTIDKNLNVYFVTKSETDKYKNMRVNKNAAITISDYESFKTVQLKGEVKLPILSEIGKDVIINLEKLFSKKIHKWKIPISLLKKGDYKFVKFIPHWIRSTNYKQIDNLIDFQRIDV